MLQYIDAIDELDTMSKDAAVLRMMMADSFEIKYDNEGRINIPETLFCLLILIKLLKFLWGVGRSFMIWSIMNIRYNMKVHKKFYNLMVRQNLFLKNLSKYSYD